MKYNKKEISWAFYDWANSAFATTVMAGFFPIFFKKYWALGEDISHSTFLLGLGNSLGSIIVALLAPILGAMADRGSSRKKFLLVFALLGIVMTGSLSLISQGDWPLAIVIFVMAFIGFAGANVFYDSFLVFVADEKRVHRVSALGFSLGYLGGGLLFTLNVLMTIYPETFFLADKSQAIKVSFFLVACWWLAFTIPLLLFVDEPGEKKKINLLNMVKEGLKQFTSTFNKIRKLRVIALFLLGYWFYIDGVDTVIRMAVDYGLSLGFKTNDLILALLITQFVGFPATLVFGVLGQKLGAKRGIYLALIIYTGATIWAFFMTQTYEFYALAIVIGLAQGGIQALSRSLYSNIIPSNQTAEFFGFYNMLGKFAAVLGPIVMGTVGLVTKSPRLSILSLVIFFIIGGIFLFFVDEKEGKLLARELKEI
jgi:UMF1 family MFS transporter